MEGGIDSVSSVIGGIGAILCALLGTISNGLTMWVILKRSKIRGHLTSPLLFLMCLSNFVFSLIGLPIKVEWATGSLLHQKLENLPWNFMSLSNWAHWIHRKYSQTTSLKTLSYFFFTITMESKISQHTVFFYQIKP